MAVVVIGGGMDLSLVATMGVATALLFSYNSRRVGRVLDSYKGVPVYDNGLLFFLSLILGSLMLWGAWRLIRGPRVKSPVA